MAAYAGQLNLFGKPVDENLEGGLISSAFTQMRTVSAFSVQFRVSTMYNQLTRDKLNLYRDQAYITGVSMCLCVCVSVTVCSLVYVRKFIYVCIIYGECE